MKKVSGNYWITRYIVPSIFVLLLLIVIALVVLRLYILIIFFIPSLFVLLRYNIFSFYWRTVRAVYINYDSQELVVDTVDGQRKTYPFHKIANVSSIAFRAAIKIDIDSEIIICGHEWAGKWAMMEHLSGYSRLKAIASGKTSRY